jgi:hypothetical protein
VKGPVKGFGSEPVQGPVKQPLKGFGSEPVQGPVKQPLKEPEKEPVKGPVKGPVEADLEQHHVLLECLALGQGGGHAAAGLRDVASRVAVVDGVRQAVVLVPPHHEVEKPATLAHCQRLSRPCTLSRATTTARHSTTPTEKHFGCHVGWL